MLCRVFAAVLVAIAVSAAAPSAWAASRGISVTVADRASGRTAEVQLYRKAYAVVVGIDR